MSLQPTAVPVRERLEAILDAAKVEGVRAGAIRIQVTNKILRAPAVDAKTGLSQSQRYKQMALGLFPRPILLTPDGSIVGWLESEIDEWIEQRVKARALRVIPQPALRTGEQDARTLPAQRGKVAPVNKSRKRAAAARQASAKITTKSK